MNEPARHGEPQHSNEKEEPGPSLRGGITRTLGAVAGHLAARSELFAREASGAARRAVLLALCALVAALLLAVGYMLLALASCFLIARLAGWSPGLAGLILGALHLAGAVAIGIFAFRKRGGFFKESINQLRKDREWLSNLAKANRR